MADDPYGPPSDAQESARADRVAPWDKVTIDPKKWLSAVDAGLKIGVIEDQYFHDANFLGAWKAIAIATRGGVARPEWALAYVDRVALAMEDLVTESSRSGEPPKDEAIRILRALGMNRGRGRRSMFAEWLAAEQDKEMFEVLMSVVDPNCGLDGKPFEKLDYAYQVVAEKYDCDPSTVARAAGRYVRSIKAREEHVGEDKLASTVEGYIRHMAARQKGTK